MVGTNGVVVIEYRGLVAGAMVKVSLGRAGNVVARMGGRLHVWVWNEVKCCKCGDSWESL